jgi:hypothetical protein
MLEVSELDFFNGERVLGGLKGWFMGDGSLRAGVVAGLGETGNDGGTGSGGAAGS